MRAGCGAPRTGPLTVRHDTGSLVHRVRRGSFPECARLGSCKLSVLHVSGEWMWFAARYPGCSEWKRLFSSLEKYSSGNSRAAAEGAVYEFYMRLLADKVPDLRQSAYGEKLEDVEGLIVAHFASVLSEDEKNLLKLCRQLRNKKIGRAHV